MTAVPQLFTVPSCSRSRSRFALALMLAGASQFLIFCGETKPADAPANNPADDAPALVKKGRALFDKNKFNLALKEFERALLKAPADKDARFLCGLAAYWARMPDKALSYWNQLADQTARGGNAEWDITRHRVMALSATQDIGAADMAIERMRELRASGKASAGSSARGFVREHFFLEDVRAGCWEVFDDHNEAPNVWTFSVARPASEKQNSDQLVATLAVERAPLPGGGAGFIFSEETSEHGRELRKIYKRWVERPNYAEVRELALSVIKGDAHAIEEKVLPKISDAGALENDVAGLVPPHIKAMRLEPQAEAITAAAWRLSEVKADVTQLARIPAEDPPALAEYMHEFNTRYPHAARDASDLAERVLTARAGNLLAACEKITRMDARGSYLEFAMLTALNTRGRDIPSTLLESFAASKDFLVRQTSNLLLARMGEKAGLERLLDEAQQADARGCELLYAACSELLGAQIDSPPSVNIENAPEKLSAWKLKLSAWRAANFANLNFAGAAQIQNGGALWTLK